MRAGAGVAVAATLSACGGTDDGVGADGRVTIEMWHGQTDTGREGIEALVEKFHRVQSAIRVDLGGGVLSDAMLQKITAALASGSYPDIAYIFGSDLAGVARSPKVVDLSETVHAAPTPWEDYWDPSRQAVTINGRVRASPAVLDALAVICNKRLFEEAGIPLPQAGWTWTDFLATAQRLTDAQRGVFGTGWPGVGDEDTVWRLWPMVWDLGGDVVAEDGRTIGFKDVGVRALETVEALARAKSVYIDPKPGSEQMYQVFASGRMGMVLTGPWQIPDITQAEIDYHVVPLPTYSGRPMTICGPDTWTVFDNGSARVRAARTFVSWLAQPDQDIEWALTVGSLPLGRACEAKPEWRAHAAETNGLEVFTHALETARVRPVHPAYPQISMALGEAIVSVLLGKSSPTRALNRCAAAAKAALVIPR
ncbi:extracellular solute-binding protein [Embleya sp. NPDC050154]|uniref:extracellular solute-binding protein n=1 Tax=unclassified Embleya TaxID=2699296 RepID=UPI0037B2243C